MSLFTSWFNTKLVVSKFPDLDNLPPLLHYGYIINVSDEYSEIIHEFCNDNHIMYHWFPMNETAQDMGINSIYAAMHIMWKAEENQSRILVHCMSGKNRSVTTVLAYYFMRTGSFKDNIGNDRLRINIDRGVLPSRLKFTKFMKALKSAILDDVRGDRTLDRIKMHCWNS